MDIPALIAVEKLLREIRSVDADKPCGVHSEPTPSCYFCVWDALTALSASHADTQRDLALCEAENDNLQIECERQVKRADTLSASHEALTQELAQARTVLNPNCAEETLVGAIRNLQQAHLSEKGNAEAAEAQVAALTAPPRTPYESGLCCMAAHANAVPPWTCACPCHARQED
jgi:hypothetical protein